MGPPSFCRFSFTHSRFARDTTLLRRLPAELRGHGLAITEGCANICPGSQAGPLLYRRQISGRGIGFQKKRTLDRDGGTVFAAGHSLIVDVFR